MEIKIASTTSNNGNDMKIIGRILLLLGIIFIVVSIIIGTVFFIVSAKDKHLRDVCTDKVTGIVIDFTEHTSSSKSSSGHRRTSTTYARIVEYEVDGDNYELTEKVSTSGKPRIGSKVTIMYNPDDPDEAYIKGAMKTSTIMLIVGVPFILVGIGMTIGACVCLHKAKAKTKENYDL